MAVELERSDKERRAALRDSANRGGEDSALAQAEATQKLIEAEQAKIASYEGAFSQIKEATGVADVNEVIQKFLTQEETHQVCVYIYTYFYLYISICTYIYICMYI